MSEFSDAKEHDILEGYIKMKLLSELDGKKKDGWRVKDIIALNDTIKEDSNWVKTVKYIVFLYR